MTSAADVLEDLRRGPWQRRMHISMAGWSVYLDRLAADLRIERMTRIPKRQGKKIEVLYWFEDRNVDVAVARAAPGTILLDVVEFGSAEEAAERIAAHDAQIARDRDWERAAP